MKFDLALRYNDYDTKGHINNAVYLTYFEMARERAWLHVVQGDVDFPFVVAEARIRYVSEGMIGDALEIEISTAEIRNKAWVWNYAIRSIGSGAVVADGSTTQVMFDYESRQSIPIPDALREALGKL
jgi:acyl-CoA thioester hydrolase